MPPLAPLPIDAALPALGAALRAQGAAVLVAPPGSGKTTRVPPYLLDAGLVPAGKVLLLQPRRVAARLAARRIAEERGVKLGGEVGYAVRFEERSGPDTRIEVLTEGLLTRRLQGDPLLDGVAAVLLDEVHERSVHTDLALALLAEIRREVRPDLLLVAMSATVDPAPFARFLGDAPVVRADGRPHPVEITHDPRPDDRPLPVRAAAAARRAAATTAGHVLVFLPGTGEIAATAEAIGPLEGVDVLPLHGSLPLDAQAAALAPSARQKIVLSTNIAETSVTLEGVTAVVDSGLQRQDRFDVATGTSALLLVPASHAACAQRAGRAGRTAPGTCHRLWTEGSPRPAADPPGIHRADLAPVLLDVLAWGADPRAFGWFEAPSGPALARAEALLGQLGALQGGALTAQGRRLAALPVHPRLGAVLLDAHPRGCVRAAATAAALATERDPWAHAGLARSGQDDLLSRVALVDGPRSGADPRALAAVREVRDQLLRLATSALGPAPRHAEGDESAVLRAFIAGFPDRVALRRAGSTDRYQLASGAGAALDGGGPPLLIAVELQATGRGDPKIRVHAPLDEALLPIEAVDGVAWDAEREGVVRVRERRFGALVFHSHKSADLPDPAAAAAVLAGIVAEDPPRLLGLDEAATELLHRWRFLRRVAPELALPDPDDWPARLPSLLLGHRSLRTLRAVDWAASLHAELTWPQRAALDAEAPPRLGLPSGSTAAIDYAVDPPVLAARIQQVFGWASSPRVGFGRVSVVLHLLAPNHRPAQVTADLAGFWAGSYAEVRKDLRGRYPKHAWPEDPLHAIPEDRPRRRPEG